MFDHRHYVPILKWRQGEYQALFRLNDAVKKSITPLIEIPPIEWDFENGCLAKTLDEHLHPVADRIVKKWGASLAFVDACLIDHPCILKDGSHALDRVFSELRALGSTAIPVTALSRNKAYQEAVKRIISKDLRGVCLRLSFDDLAEAPAEATAVLLRFLGVTAKNANFVIDLGAPNYDPISDFAELMWGLIAGFPILEEARTITIASTAFPESMGDIKKFVKVVSRDDWLLYKAMVVTAPEGARLPTFGDYAIAYPVLPREDMRLLKPSATVRYTIDDAWHITKGKNVRDNGFDQYKTICSAITKTPHFMGEKYSEGDKYIGQCGEGKVGTGNLTTWRWVGTNHHLTKVTQDIATLFAP